MKKTVEIAFPAGTEVFVMHNNVPVQTKIRAVKYSESIEIVKAADTNDKTEHLKQSCTYSTVAGPNNPLTEAQIAETKEELIKKIFGAVQTDPE